MVRRIAALLTLFMILAAGLAFLFRLELGRLALQQGLRVLQIELTHIELSSLEWNSIQAKHVEATFNSTSVPIGLEARELSLTFHPLQAFRGKFNFLSAKDIEIHISQSPSSRADSNSDSQPQSLNALLRPLMTHQSLTSLLHSYVNRVSVKSVHIVIPEKKVESSGLIEIPGQSVFHTKILKKDFSQLELEMSFSSPKDSITVDLFEGSNSNLAHLQLLPSATEAKWNGEYFLRLEKFFEILRHVALFPDNFIPTFGTGSTLGGNLQLAMAKEDILLLADTNFRISSLSLPYANLFSFSTQASLRGNLSPRGWTFSVPEAKLKYKKLQSQQFTSSNTDLFISSLQITPRNGVTDVRVRCSPCNLSFPSQNLNAKSVSLDFTQERDLQEKLTGILQAQSFTWGVNEQMTSKVDIQSKLSVHKNVLRSDFQLTSPSTGIEGSGALVQSLQSASGEIHFEIPNFEFDENSKRLSKLYSPWHYPVDIDSGSASVHGRVHWGPENSEIHSDAPMLKAELKSLSGTVSGFPFKGLSARPQMLGNPFFHETQPFELTLDGFSVGVPFVNLRSKIEKIAFGDKFTLQIADIQAEALGGDVRAQNFNFDSTKKNNPALVTLSKLDLSKLAELEQTYDLKATGAISGSLPFSLGTKTVEIRDGQVAAHPPGGLIQLTSKDGSGPIGGGNPGLKLVFDSLENYEYTSLLSEVDYHPDGRLILGVKLKGRNPNKNKGRPVHFNVNVEENIPALLKSLSLSSYLEQSLEKKLKNKFNG